MKSKEIIAKLKGRQERLKILSNSDSSEKVLNAKNYIQELEDLKASVELINKEIYIVPLGTLDVKAKKADFASIEEEGYFFRLCLIQNFPYADIYFLYLAPLSSI